MPEENNPEIDKQLVKAFEMDSEVKPGDENDDSQEGDLKPRDDVYVDPDEENEDELQPGDEGYIDPDLEDNEPVTFNLSEFQEGKYKTVEDLTEFLGKYDELTNTVSTLETSKTKLEEEAGLLKSTLEQVKNDNPLAKYPEFYKLAKFSEANPENAKFYQQLALGNPDPLTVLMNDFIIEHPEFKDREADAKRLVSNRYKDYLGKDADNESEEYGDAKLLMEADASTAKKRLLSDLEKIEIPKVRGKEEIESERDDYLSTWKEPFKKIVTEIGTIKIELPDPADKSKTVEFTALNVDAKAKDRYVRLAASMIGRGGLDPKEAPAMIKAEVEKQIIADNLNAIIEKSYNDGHTDGQQGHRRRVTNSKPIKSTKKATRKSGDARDTLGKQLISDSNTGKF